MFKLKFLILLFIQICFCRELGMDQHKTLQRSINGRIVGGTKAGTSLKYMAYLEVNPHDPKHPKDREICGGTVLSNQHILTAAHCLEDGRTVDYILLNAYNIEKSDAQEPRRKRVYPGNYFVHERYDNPQDANDIAVIKLKKPITLNSFINKVNLEPKSIGKHKYRNSLTTAYGWGITSDDPEDQPDELQKVDIRLIEDDNCAAIADKQDVAAYPGNGEICTSSAGVKIPCQGDSGGPLMLNGFQIGVISRGVSNSCMDATPNVYVRVGHYRDWIDLQLRK